MKVLFVGDTHCDNSAARVANERAVEAGCDAIVQAGDFGYAFGTHQGRRFLETCESSEVPWYAIHGNHDDSDYLIEHGMFHADEVVRFPGLLNVFYIPNGVVVDWDGVTMMGIGGAFSIDRARRVRHISWWPESEKFDEVTWERVEQHGHVDIVVSHDCPQNSLHITALCADGFDLVGYKNDAQSKQFRRDMQHFHECLEPRVHIHGHYHEPYEERMGDSLLVGLNCNAMRGAHIVFDMEAMDIVEWI